MFSNLVNIGQSFSVAFADRVRSIESEGLQIVKMQTGDPDFATHPNTVAAATTSMVEGETHYCDSRGISDLRRNLARKLRADNAINCDPKDNILVTQGAVHGISMAIRAVIDSGDECIIIEPYWRAYEMDVLLAGGAPVFVRTCKEKGFQIVAEEIIQQVTPRTKAIVINTPNNPSGAVYKKEELVKLAKAAANLGIYLISDEVYESITFLDNQHYSIASDPSVFDWTISAFSFSKTYAMTGWRIGYLVASKSVIDELLKLSQFSVTSITTFSQKAASLALMDPDVQVYVESMRKSYEERRNRIEGLVKGTWLEEAMILPQGTFYCLIDISRFAHSSLEFATKILESEKVAFTPGIAFGDGMNSYLRMCFANSHENIEKAVGALIRIENNFSE